MHEPDHAPLTTNRINGKPCPADTRGRGDARPLVTASDDLSAGSAPGDDIALTFERFTSPPPLPRDWTRTFTLGPGWIQQGDEPPFVKSGSPRAAAFPCHEPLSVCVARALSAHACPRRVSVPLYTRSVGGPMPPLLSQHGILSRLAGHRWAPTRPVVFPVKTATYVMSSASDRSAKSHQSHRDAAQHRSHHRNYPVRGSTEARHFYRCGWWCSPSSLMRRPSSRPSPSCGHPRRPIPNEHRDLPAAKARELDIHIQSGTMLEIDVRWPQAVFNTRASSAPTGLFIRIPKVNPWLPFELHASPHD